MSETSTASFRQRIYHAASWTMSALLLSQLLRLGSNLIMTRLLVPEMFGIMAIAILIILGLNLMSDMGIRQNIVQSKRGESEVFLNTAWSLQILRGFSLWTVAVIISWFLYLLTENQWFLLEGVYAEPVLPFVLVSISFSIVIDGFLSTKFATAHRNLALNKVVSIELIGQVLGFIIMISWALIDRSIWALVAGSLVSSFVKVVLSHSILPGVKNRLSWDWSVFYELFHFSKWILLTSILGFFGMNADRLLLGGLIDSKTLGIYAIAFLVANAVQQVVNKIVGSVAFPALSEVARNRPDKLKETYYKFRLPIDAFTLFISGFFFMSGHLFIELLYDDHYASAGYMLEILSLVLLTERYSLADQCFISLGKPRLILPMVSIRVVVLFVLLPIVHSYYGLYGALWVIGLNRVATLPALFYLKIKLSLFDLKNELYILVFLLLGFILGWFINLIV